MNSQTKIQSNFKKIKNTNINQTGYIVVEIKINFFYMSLVLLF